MIYDSLAQESHNQGTVDNGSGDEDQSSRGVLNDSQPGQFVTTGEEIAELPIASIQPCRNIPDYRDLTESPHPIVIQSPDACHCIDGWNLIEQAQSEGRSTIRCHVFKIDRHSETELAIRKGCHSDKTPRRHLLICRACIEIHAVFLSFSMNPPMIRCSFLTAVIGVAQISLTNGKTTSGLYYLKDSANRRPPSINTFSMGNVSATVPSTN